MGDNLNITPGTGAVAGADDIDGVLYQRIKIITGIDGVNNGDVSSSNPMPISDAGASVTVDGTVTANLSATDNAVLDSIDGKITACNTGAVVISSGTTAVTQGTATNLKTQAEVYQGGSAVAVANPLEVKLPAATVTTLTPPAAITGFATETTLGTVHGHVDSIDGKITACNTGAVVVSSGAITASQGTAANLKCEATLAAAQTLATLTTITNAVTVAQSTASSLKCEEASASAIATSLAIIDDWDSSDTCKVTLQAGTAVVGELIPSTYPTTDNAKFMKKYYTSAGAATDGIIWSPGVGTRWYVTDLIINTSAAATITLEDDLAAGDSPVMKFELAANGGMVCNFKTPLASGEDEADLMITTTAGNVYVTATGYEA